jgi:hypothetical protein
MKNVTSWIAVLSTAFILGAVATIPAAAATPTGNSSRATTATTCQAAAGTSCSDDNGWQ